MADEIRKAIPTPEIVTAGGRAIEIRPIRMRQIVPLLSALDALGEGMPKADEIAALEPEGWIALIREHGEGVMPIVSIVTGCTLDELGDMDPAEFLHVVTIAIEVNSDFFTERLAPRVRALTDAIRASGGLTRSSD
jgi:hypothetical protein